MAILNGTTGDDKLTGGLSADTISGLGGNDTISGRAGNDKLDGGAGNDVIDGGGGSDTILGGDGIDWLAGGRGNDVLSGGAGNDVFVFASGDRQDIITDFAAGDAVKISGYSAAQTVAQVGTSVVVTLSTADKITFSNATLATVKAALQFDGGGSGGGGGGGPTGGLTGTSGKDTLNGTAGNDLIQGLGGDDTINGGGGNDRIIGGAGSDVMTGGAGADTFVFLSASDSPLMTSIYCDFITDWSAEDRIDLSGIDANEAIAGNQAFVFGGYSFAHPPTVTTPGTFTIGGFGGEIYVIGFTNNVAGADFEIAIWSSVGESGVKSDQFIF